MILSPQTRELRRMLDASGTPYATDDSEAENDDGCFQHVERTDTEIGFALHAWTRDADGAKRFQSDLGKFSDYIEVDVGETREVLTVDDAFILLSGADR